jgi:hypothetical protein
MKRRFEPIQPPNTAILPEEELKKRYFEAKAKGQNAVYVADLYPNNLFSAGVLSFKLLSRLFEPDQDATRTE